MTRKCPTCNGSGRFFIPSDGYENSKSGRCDECGGDGTFSSFSKRMLSYKKKVLEDYRRIKEAIPELEKLVQEMETENESKNVHN